LTKEPERKTQMDKTKDRAGVRERMCGAGPVHPETPEQANIERPVVRGWSRQENATVGPAMRRSGSVRICSDLDRPPVTKSAAAPSNRVLLVDDDPWLAQAITVGLESHGYQVLTANDGREALELLRSEHPCLVLLDLEMPGMTGWQFRKEQCSDPSISSVPVVVVSSRTDAERQARVMHVAAGLQKPVDLDQLHATVRAQCATGLRAQ
jgi:CheY-like chemotaxis protein